MDLVKLDKITFQYSDCAPVIKNVSLTIREGEIVLLIGPTGSGKSTLLEIICGVAPSVTGGEIFGNAYIRGLDILHHPGSARGIVSLVQQDPEPQLVNLTVDDEVAFGPENLLLSREEISSRVNWAITSCRLEPHRHAFVYALSGGQKQRIAIAAGLAMKPEILLLDGPLTNLDPVGSTEVLETIRDLVGHEVKTIIVSSNKIDTLLPLANRIIVMDKGSILLDGSPEFILYQEAETLSRLGLFLPEVSRLWPVVRRYHANSALPRTPTQLVEKLQVGEPYISRLAYMPGRAPSKPAVIELDDVRFGYGKTSVIEGISFKVFQGEFLAIVGQNGSGKSTLASLICGLRRPQGGIIRILGKDTKTCSPQGVVGFVFQYPEHQFVTSTIGEELRYGLSNTMKPDELENRVVEVLALIGMTGHEADTPYSLSVGEKRMLSVATMLMLRPQILILDEPTTGLDFHLTENLMRILGTYVTQYGMTVIQISHDMEQIAQYCTRVIVINDGSLLFDGKPVSLFINSAVLEKAKLEAPPICQVAMSLFPGSLNIPITVDRFLEEVQYARI